MLEAAFLYSPSGLKFAKEFTDTGVKSYPRIKEVTSEHRTVTLDNPGLTQLFNELQAAGDKGWCLLKGVPTRKLNKESRKGTVNRDDTTSMLVLDIDGFDLSAVMPDFKVPLTRAQIIDRAERLIKMLPAPFHTVSYIVQASASVGRSLNKLSAHLFFFLKTPAYPNALKDYLTYLNFAHADIEQQISLSASGNALSFRIDRTSCDNGRLVYIAPPAFHGTQTDPFTSPKERMALVLKEQDLLDIAGVIAAINPEKVGRNCESKLKELRQARGLKHKKGRVKSVTAPDGSRVVVTSDPDRMRMTFAEDEGKYVRYNVNGGDSNAYWVFKTKPDIVFNFKGEPNFLFEKADPDTYRWHVETYADLAVAEVDGHKPIVFLDYSTAKYHYGLYSPAADRMESIYQCGGMDHIKHFCNEHGLLPPETLPVWRYEFRPTDPRVVDIPDKFINRYEAPDHIRYPVDIPQTAIGVELGYSAPVVQSLCPTIYDLLMSVCGDGAEEFEYFINWLAFVTQRRTKAMTAWLFHGVPGTGKGLLYHNVLAPLLGEKYAMMKRTQDIEEKFNQWMQQCLLFVVDEFHMNGSKKHDDLINKVKNMITETRGTIRAMGTDQIDRDLYANVLFFSNDRDAVRIQEGDRRFNIAPRQETPILERHPYMFIEDRVQSDCKTQLPLFASFLMQFKIDEQAVILPLENDAKQLMRDATKEAAEAFVEAIIRGDLDYFVPILDEAFRSTGEDYVSPAKNYLKGLIRDWVPGVPTKTWTAELRPLYNILCGLSANDHSFGRLLARKGLNAKDIRKKGVTKRGFEIVWQISANDIKELQKTYLTEADMQYGKGPQLLMNDDVVDQAEVH